MARQSLSPMKELDYYVNQAPAEVKHERVGRKKKDAPMTHLKYLRKKNGYTLEALSDITNVSISYLSRLESGSRRLNTDLIRRLAHAFRCSPSELLQEISHDGNVVTAVDFGRRRRNDLNPRDCSMPLYKVVPCENEESDDESDLKVNICSSSEWKSKPAELMGRNDVIAIKAEKYFLPYFSETSTLYLEPANNLVPESTVVILDCGKILIKKIWSVTPTTLQLCDICDIDALKQGGTPKNDLISVERSNLDATYKVVGYADFCLA